MKSFKITQNDQGQRLNKFIEKAFLNVPKSLIYKSIRKKNVKINKKALKANYILNFGDIVEVYGLDEFFIKKEQKINFKAYDGFEKLDIVFEDENILVLNKKEGIMSQPNSKQKNSLIDFVKAYLIEKKEYFPEKENSFSPAFCTRLDTNTKGLIVAGKNAKALRNLNQLIKNGQIKKTYICEVEGIMEKNHEILVGFWSKDFKKNKAKITSNKREFSKKVVTEYFVLKRAKKTARLKVVILTGKSHQIRAHLKQINHPIVGDFKYGSKTKSKLKLICCELFFNCKEGELKYLNQKKITLKKLDF